MTPRIDDSEAVIANLFSSKKIFKLDAELTSSGNHLNEYTFLLAVLTGIAIIDLPPDPNNIKEAKLSIDKSLLLANDLLISKASKPLLSVSIHTNNFTLNDTSMITDLLTDCIESGARLVEVHLDRSYNQCFDTLFNDLLEDYPQTLFSLSLNRDCFSNTELVDIISRASTLLKKRFCLEVQSSLDNDLMDALQSVSTIDIINKQIRLRSRKFNKIPLFLNALDIYNSVNLASNCKVPFDGIAIRPQLFPAILKKQIVPDKKIIHNDYLYFLNYLSKFLEIAQ